jgi:hypothetical protein
MANAHDPVAPPRPLGTVTIAARSAKPTGCFSRGLAAPGTLVAVNVPRVAQ